MTTITMEQVEQIILTNQESFRTTGHYINLGGLLDAAIYTVAGKTTTDTLFDLVPREGTDMKQTKYYSAVGWDEEISYVTYVANIVAKTLDTVALAESPRNLLNKYASNDWKDGYRNAVAELVIREGKPVSLEASYYGWEDNDIIRDKMDNPDSNSWDAVAVLDVIEDQWSEFQGTFAENDGNSHGFVASVIHRNGVCRWYRYEGDMSTMIRGLFTL